MEASTKLCLSLHTTTPNLGLAVGQIILGELDIIHDRGWELGKGSSTLIHHYLSELISPQQWQDLLYVAVATGVGSFTGTRVGVVLARTLGQQLNIPVYGIPCAALDSLTQDRSGAVQLLHLAHDQWRNHYLPDYSTVLPLYGL